MYTFPAAKSSPPHLRQRPRTMLDGKKATRKSSRPRRAARRNVSEEAKDDSMPSHAQPSSSQVPSYGNIQPERHTPNPMKKRLLRAWDVPSRANGNRAANASNSRPAATKTADQSETPASTTGHPPVRPRRYPKLLKVDKDGQFVANPLKLADGIPPPAPLVVPGVDSSFRPGRGAPGPSQPPPKPRDGYSYSSASPYQQRSAGPSRSQVIAREQAYGAPTAPPYATNGQPQQLMPRTPPPVMQQRFPQGAAGGVNVGYCGTSQGMHRRQQVLPQSMAQTGQGTFVVPLQRGAWGSEGYPTSSQAMIQTQGYAPTIAPRFSGAPPVMSGYGSSRTVPVRSAGSVDSNDTRGGIAHAPYSSSQGYQPPVPHVQNHTGGYLRPLQPAQHSLPSPHGVVSTGPRHSTSHNPTSIAVRPGAGSVPTLNQIQVRQPSQRSVDQRMSGMVDASVPTTVPQSQYPSQSHVSPVSQDAPEQGSQLSAGEGANVENAEKVIQVGKRCGTVKYWRNSLQMPKNSGVENAIPKDNALGVAKGISKPVVKQATRPAVISPAQRTSVGSNSAGPMTGADEAAWPQEEVVPGERGLVDPHATRTPLDTGQEHEFWRNATKLPSVSSDRARQRRLADGKRRAVDGSSPGGAVKSPSTIRYGNQGEAIERVENGAGRFCSYSGTVPQPVYDSDDEDRITAVAPRASSTHTLIPNGDPDGAFEVEVVEMTPQPDGASEVVEMTPQMVIDEEQTEMRRLHMTKDYELRKLEAFAESRYHVKMNLRGRNKLENWLAKNDSLTAHSVLFLVLVLNLDRRLISKNVRERKHALEDMDNEHLRMLEALMSRTCTRDGHTNWAVLTANFSVES